MLNGNDLLGGWLKMQFSLVLYFFFLYWLMPEQYVHSIDTAAPAASSPSNVERMMAAASLAIENHLGGGSMRVLRHEMAPLGTLQRLLSFGSFAVFTITGSQSVAKQMRIQNDAQMYGIANVGKDGVGQQMEYTRVLFGVNAMLHVMFALVREANVWDADEMSDNYSFMSGIFMVFSVMAIAMDMMGTSSTQKLVRAAQPRRASDETVLELQ